jgi:hypothetical protein
MQKGVPNVPHMLKSLTYVSYLYIIHAYMHTFIHTHVYAYIHTRVYMYIGIQGPRRSM